MLFLEAIYKLLEYLFAVANLIIGRIVPLGYLKRVITDKVLHVNINL